MRPFTASLALLLVCAVPSSAQPTAPLSAITAPAVLSAEQVRQAVETLASSAEARYVDPAGGAKMAASLRANLAGGHYAGVSDPSDLAARLTLDLRKAVPDVHLRVAYQPDRSAETIVRRDAGQAGQVPRPFGRIDPRSSEAIARSNFGFETLQRLDGNIGYIKINRFVPPEMSEPTARAAMDFLANSDAIIVDLRGNIGGSPELVRYLISHFTGAEPVALMTRYSRDGDTTETMMSVNTLSARLRPGTQLHVLIDRSTASAAEMFAYFVQQKRLGTVYGETSSGAGQGGNLLPIGSGLEAFLPHSKIVDGPGWEAAGISPDVGVDPRDALGAAHRAALRQLLDGTADPHIQREREWVLEMAEASARPYEGSADLGRFEGRFGMRGFEARNGILHVVGATGRSDPMMRISETVFRTNAARYVFNGERDKANEVVIETLSGTRTHNARTVP